MWCIVYLQADSFRYNRLQRAFVSIIIAKTNSCLVCKKRQLYDANYNALFNYSYKTRRNFLKLKFQAKFWSLSFNNCCLTFDVIKIINFITSKVISFVVLSNIFWNIMLLFYIFWLQYFTEAILQKMGFLQIKMTNFK